MPLKLSCPRCAAPNPLSEPLPLPGSEIKCIQCGSSLAVSYPPGVMERLEARGKQFASTSPPPPPRVPRPPADPTQVEHDRATTAMPDVPAAPLPPDPTRPTEHFAEQPQSWSTQAATEVPGTEVERTQVDDGFHTDNEDHFDRTVPAVRSPYGALPGNVPEPEAGRPVGVDVSDLESTHPFEDPNKAAKPASRPRGNDVTQDPPAKTKKRAGCFGSLASIGCMGVIGLGLVGGAAAGGGYWYYSQDLPTIETLRAYEPPTVTRVLDKDGELLGEIYDQRRYVVPIDEIPDHVKNAFIAAEDANFWNHGGVDYMGIIRAVLRNAAAGRKAQGASTITQQVAKNFLLTRDKKIERKIKEAILSWRIETAYEKEHILYLYLNEIYLGSKAYGVEAASRAYFDKGVKDLTIAEAAIIAGLPPRPSDYSPHRNWDKAKARQEYVVGQMVAKGYITQAEADAALAEEVAINPRGNTFLEQAPHFTEYARRYLVEKYGEEAVLNGGLEVTTTCDLELQQVAQDAVTKQVFEVDQRMGFRRDALQEHLKGDDAIAAKRKEHEAAMRKAWAKERDPAGRIPEPPKSELVAGERYPAVLLEVKKNYARVGIGDHEGIIPLAWTEWAYDPNPKRSWRYRTATDLTAKIDTDDDGKDDTAILQKGDVVEVKVEALRTTESAVVKAFKSTPGADKDFVALRLWQTPEVEAAMASMEVKTGAVRAMVGGHDFTRSQLNRVVQSKRQVGSTFKPIVYAAGLESEKLTTASMVADAPLAFATNNEFVWKPGNYSDEYMGNITLRKALALSKNTCTVRVLEAVDPGMNDDVVYSFARRLGIGGPPTHTLPEDWQVTPESDLLCPWTLEHEESTVCSDHYPPRTDTDISNTRHRKNLTPEDKHYCRTCDMSMGLGSASLSMEELMRAYSAFASGGYLVESYYIDQVKDREGKVLERHEPAEHHKVLEPEVASLTTWLLQGVVTNGTAARASAALGMRGLAGKTGTTNDEKDAWFIGFTPEIVTAAWVGFDQPKPMGVSSTGGRTALPIWIDYMKVAAPKENDQSFPMLGEIEYANIDEETGRRVNNGGRRYPFIKGTAPESTGIDAGQLTIEDLTTEL